MHEAGLRIVWFAGKKDLRPAEQADLFLAHLPRLEREVIKLGAGPWGLALTHAGLTPVPIRRTDR